MNLPAPPTDNLYKFFALAGLALSAFCFVYLLTQVGDLELKSIEVRTQAKILEVDVSALKHAIAVLEAKKDPTAEEIRQRGVQIQQLEIKFVEHEGQQDRLRTLTQNLRTVLNLLSVGSLLGLPIAGLGFYLWYVRVQRPADKLAREKRG